MDTRTPSSEPLRHMCAQRKKCAMPPCDMPGAYATRTHSIDRIIMWATREVCSRSLMWREDVLAFIEILDCISICPHCCVCSLCGAVDSPRRRWLAGLCAMWRTLNIQTNARESPQAAANAVIIQLFVCLPTISQRPTDVVWLWHAKTSCSQSLHFGARVLCGHRN